MDSDPVVGGGGTESTVRNTEVFKREKSGSNVEDV